MKDVNEYIPEWGQVSSYNNYDDYEDDEEVDDENAICDDDNDRCRVGEMQITVNWCSRLTNHRSHSMVTTQLYFSRLHARAFST